MRVLRRAGLALLVLLLLLAAATFAAYVHLGSQAGRDAVRDLLQSAANDGLYGSLEIGQLSALSLSRVAARDVRVLDASGEEVIFAKYVEADIGPYSTGKRHLTFTAGHVREGRLTLRDDDDGLPTLLQAFTPAPDDSPQSWLMRQLYDLLPLTIAIDNILLADVDVLGSLLGLDDIAGHVDEGKLDIEIADEVDVQLRGVRGTLSEPFGFRARIDEIEGTLSSRLSSIVDLRVAAGRERPQEAEEQASAHVTFSQPDAERPDVSQLMIDVQAASLSTETIAALGFDFLPPMRTRLSGSLVLDGPPEALSLQAALHTDAGDARVQGSLGEPVQVTLSSETLDLARAFDGMPQAAVAGDVTFVASEGQPGVDVTAELKPTRVGGLLLPSMDVTGTLLEDAFELHQLTSRARGARLRGSGKIPFSGTIILSVQAHYDEISHDHNLHALVPNLGGEVDADLTVRIPAVSPVRLDIQGEVTAQDLTYGAFQAGMLRATGRIRGDASRPKVSVKVRSEDTHVGTYDLGDGDVTIDGGPREYGLSGVFARQGSRHFALDGSLAALPHELLLRATSLELLVGDAAFRGSLGGLHLQDNDAIRVDDLMLVSRSQRLEAKGAVSPSGTETLTAQLQDFDVAALAPLLGPSFPLRSGRADAALQVTGDVKRPRFQLQGALRGGQAYGLDEVHALYLLTYADGDVEVDGEVDLGDLGLLRLGGIGQVRTGESDVETALREATYDLELELDALDLGRLPQLKEHLTSGVISGDLTLKGSVANPDIAGELTTAQLCLGDDSLMTVGAKVRYVGDDLQLELDAKNQNGALAAGEIRATVALETLLDGADKGLAWPRDFTVTMSVAEQHSDNWPGIVRERLPFAIRGGGTVALSRAAGGKLAASAHASAVPAETALSACGDSPPARLTMDAQVNGGALTFALRGFVDHQQVLASEGGASLSLDDLLQRRVPRLSSLSMESDVSGLPLSTVPGLCEESTGLLHATLSVRNALSTYPTFRGELTSTFSPYATAQSERQASPLRSCDNEPARLELKFNGHTESGFTTGTLGGCGGQDARITGHAPLRWTPDMLTPAFREDSELTVSVRFKKTQLRAVLDRIPGVHSGEAVADGVLRVSGKPDDLEYWGEVELSQGRLRIIATGQTVEDVQAKVVFAEHEATLERFEARADQGLLQLKGRWLFEGALPRHAQLALTLDEFPIRREGIKLAWLTGAAALEADIDAERSRTAIQIHNLDVRLPNRTPGSLQALEDHPDVSLVSDADKPERTRAYALEFQIKSEEPMRVARDDFEASVSTELAVSYQDPTTRLGGYLEFRRGRFEVFGKEFDLVQGGLRFDGGTTLDPEVNLIANHTVSSNREQVTVTVRGTLSNPDIRFSSDACEGQAGALSLLVAGRCTEDPDSPSQTADTESAFATGLLSGVLTLGARRELGGLIPNLAVESGTRGYATRVRAGVEADSIIPDFMRPFIQKVYLQGAVNAARTDTQAEVANQDASLDFLLQLYFPHNIVGSGHFAVDSWGLDVVWEP